MKLNLSVLTVAVVALFSMGVSTATAAPTPKTIDGKTVSFKAGKLKVKNKKGTATYVVGKSTDCGYSKGQMGNSMPCSSLKKKKYMAKKVTVTWHAKNGRRIADVVAVHL
ncbi:MAG: hypothetical protein J0H98_03210 [Solirubrobacterales bacterium]|nr:hypothetical protein [Solirubrobacterales bacterium]